MNFMTPVIGILSGIIGSMGLGGGGVLIIFLALENIDQVMAQGINLIFFIPMGIVTCIINYRKGLIDNKAIILYSLIGMVGAFIGWYFLRFLNGIVLRKIFGSFLLIMGLIQLFTSSKKK